MASFIDILTSNFALESGGNLATILTRTNELLAINRSRLDIEVQILAELQLLSYLIKQGLNISKDDPEALRDEYLESIRQGVMNAY